MELHMQEWMDNAAWGVGTSHYFKIQCSEPEIVDKFALFITLIPRLKVKSISR